MPLDTEQAAELKKMIGVARKRALNFGICMGAKPDGTILVLHRMRSPDVLMREAKKAGDTAKTTYGSLAVSGKVLSLSCVEEPPANLARSAKLFLSSVGVKLSVKILDAEGKEVQSDIDEDPDDDAEAGDESPDPNEAIWKAAEEKFTPLVARAASEATVADPSKLRAAWAYALEIAGEGDFGGALKVVARVKAALDADDGVSHSAAATFDAATAKLRPRVNEALAGKAGPIDDIRKVWAFAYGKAEANPPDFPSANKALAALMPLLDKAEKALAANDGAADTPDGIQAGTVNKRLAELKTGKALLTELKGMNGRLSVALLHQADKGAEIKSLISEVQSSVSVNDLDAARVALFKIENIIYHAGKHHAREQQDLTRDLGGLTAEMPRLLALPGETSTGLRLQRKIEAMNKLLPKGIQADDLTQAKADLAALKSAIEDMKAEEVLINRAVAQKEQAMREFDALGAQLKAARYIYTVSPAFKADVDAFKSIDDDVGEFIAKRAYASVLASLRKLEAAAKKLNARKAEFDQVVIDEAAALAARKDIEKANASARKVALTKPEAQAQFDILEEKFPAWKLAFDAKSWSDAAALGQAALDAANALIGMKAECRALKAKREEARTELRAARAKFKAALPKVDVLPRVAQLRKEGDEIKAAMLETFNSIRDWDEVKVLAKRLTQIATQLEGLKAENDASLLRKKAFLSEYKKLLPEIRAAFKITANTPEVLKLFQDYSEAYALLWEACQTGDENAPDRLVETKAAIDALNAKKQENDDAAAEAEADAKSKLATINTDIKKARDLIGKHAPALDGFLEDLSEIIGGINETKKAKKWADCEVLIARLNEVFEKVTAAAAVAAPETAKTKLAFEAKWTGALRDQITDVLAYEEVTPTMVIELDKITKLNDAIGKFAKSEYWAAALAQVEALEPLVAAKVAFKPTHDRVLADAIWVEQQYIKIDTRMQAVSGMEAVTRDMADVLATLKKLSVAIEDNTTKFQFAEIRASWASMVAAIETMERLKAEHDTALAKKEQADAGWAKINADYKKANKFVGYTKELEVLVTTFEECDREYDAAYDGYDYETAIYWLPKVEAAIKALLARQKEHDEAKAAASGRAAAALSSLKATSVDDVRKLGADKKVALLDALRAERGKLDDEQKAQQRKIYAAMDLDPEFNKLDKQRRDELGASIREDSELMEAKDNWDGTPIEQRLRLLERTLKKECEVYGMPVPRVQTYSEASRTQGFFDGDTMTINLNVHPETDFDDFYECIDTIVHENAHNYQEYLVTRLAEGLIRKGDPEYTQALMFAANSGPGDYVNSNESKAIYKKQPLEEHAWATGNGIAAMLEDVD